MKKIQSIILCLFLLSNSIIAQTAEEIYIRSEDLNKQESFVAALLQINKALATDSLNLKYLLLKGAILNNMNNFQDAYIVFSRALQVDSKNVHCYNARGHLNYRFQKFDEAITDYTNGLEYIKSDSDKIMLMLNRSAAKALKRDHQGAYDDLMILYKQFPENIDVLNNLATVCDEIGRGDETLSYLLKIVKIKSDYLPAYINIGFKYQAMKEFKNSIQYFDKAEQLSPNEPLVFSNRSYSKLKLRDYRGAIADIEKSLRLYPQNSYAYRIRALIHIEAEDFNAACKDLQTALDYGFTKMYGDEVKELQEKHCKKK
jgi:tetratricopeptide (TPR) repeat protein